MHYLINEMGVVSAHGSKKDAAEALKKVPAEERTDHAVVSEFLELSSFGLKTLTSIYNTCQTDSQKFIAKLPSKQDDQLKRVWAALEAKYDEKAKAKAVKEAEKATKAAAKEQAKADKEAAKAGTQPPAQSGGPYEPRPTSKMGLLLVSLKEHKNGATVTDLAKDSGFDESNTRTAIGIFRGKGLKIDYDREKKLYSLVA